MTPGAGRMAEWLERAWLARYLDRELSPEESEWFEGYALDKQDLLVSIDADTWVRDALVAERSRHPAAVKSSPASSALRHSRALASRWAALAASLVLGVGGGWLIGNMRPTSMDSQVVIPNPTPLLVETQRSEGPSVVEYATANTPAVSDSPFFLILVSTDAKDVVLILRNKTRVPLHDAGDGFLRALVRKAELLPPNEAVLEYRRGGSIETQALKLRRK